jgi:hypothetical protein
VSDMGEQQREEVDSEGRPSLERADGGADQRVAEVGARWGRVRQCGLVREA